MDAFIKNKTDGYWYAPPIAPGETLDYTLDCTKLLNGDTITGIDCAASPAGITVATSTFTSSSVIVRLTAATLGSTFTITVSITTASGQVFDRSFKIVCAAQ